MVDENQFRSTYHDLNEIRCVFEKALNARRCVCVRSEHFLLGGREGRRCKIEDRQQRCTDYLNELRPKARFLLGITQADGPLPHNKEIRIQVGGLEGLNQQLEGDESTDRAEELMDIDSVLSRGEEKYGVVSGFPFDLLLPAIASFQGRKRRR